MQASRRSGILATQMFISAYNSLEKLVLTSTFHARLARAVSPEDYDDILDRMSSEVKFHCKTVRPDMYHETRTLTFYNS